MTPLEKLKEAAAKWVSEAPQKESSIVAERKAFIAGAQSEEARELYEPKWIPVTKKLPEFDTLVLFAYVEPNEEDSWVVAGQINSEDGRAYNQFQDIHSDEYITPTHWMPLPLPPSPTTT